MGVTTHFSSSLFRSSLLTFSMRFPALDVVSERPGEHLNSARFRRVTGISKSASHMESSRLSVARLHSNNRATPFSVN